MDEEWRKVDGWPYEVSNLGAVRRSERACGTCVGLVLKPTVVRCGYLRVSLRSHGKGKFALVHRLVAEAFLGPSAGRDVNHKNGIKSDPRAENLEWTTKRENQLHAYAMGLQGCGEQHGQSKLTEDAVRDIRSRYAAGGVSQQKLADEHGVNQTLIGFIVRRVAWKHVT